MEVEGTTCVLFCAGHRRSFARPPCGVLASIHPRMLWVFPELQSWWHFLPTHSMKKRKETNSWGNISLQKPLIWLQQGTCCWPHHFCSSHNPLRRGRGFCPTPHSSNSPSKWGKLWSITGITRAEQQLMLSSSQIRKALTWKRHWDPILSLPGQAGPSGRSQASLGLHL